MAKMTTIRQGMYDLLSSVTINTKEAGKTHVQPWLSQQILIDSISKGLSEGVHEFVVLKCRQTGATTTCSVIELFWCLANPGVQGAIISDRTDNLERLRRIFADLLESLPSSWRSREHRLVTNNRTGMAFANGSVIDLLAAASNPDLGASRALSMCHMTECSLWRSAAGVESLKASLARKNPHRLYVWESIANGTGNWFYNHCQQAKLDKRMKFIFLGFWTCPNYSLSRDDPEYKTWWDGTLTDEEIERVRYVKAHYNYTVTPEQLAWHRRESEFRAPEYMDRHYPFTERECFIASGSGFFPSKRTLEMADALADGAPYKGYKYVFDDKFLASRIEQTRDRDDVMLKVWEPPLNVAHRDGDSGRVSPAGSYVIGIDPSGGGGGDANDHAIEVFRCYANRLVQVAEFRTNSPLTYQLAWVMCHLAGAYRDHIANLEVTGIGAAIMPEVRNLRQLAERRMLRADQGNEPVLNMIGCVRWFLYQRSDSLGGPGNIINWKTNADNKRQIFSEFRDSLMKNQIEIRSTQLVQQLQAIVEDEGWIGAGPDTGVNDDLVVAAVLAHKTWVQYRRDGLVSRGMTFESVKAAIEPANQETMLSFAFSDFYAKMHAKQHGAARRRYERF